MVSAQTGIAQNRAGTPEAPTPSAPTPSGPLKPEAASLHSPALSMDKPPPVVKGRRIAVLLGDGVDSGKVTAIVQAIIAAGQVPEMIGPTAGAIIDGTGKPLPVNRAAPNAPSVIFDAVLIPAGMAPAISAMPLAQRFLDEMFRHGKPIAAASDLAPVLEALGIPPGEGVSISDSTDLPSTVVRDLARHRFPRRVSNLTPA